MKNESLILALVPSRTSCGLARVAADGGIVWRRVVPSGNLERSLNEVANQSPEVVLVSSGGQSKVVRTLLLKMFGAKRVISVEDRDSATEARELYFIDHPPSGLWRLVPRRMQSIRVSIDDYTAVVLARRWLAQSDRRT